MESMVQIECDYKLGNVEKYLDIIFKKYTVNEERTGDVVIEIGKTKAYEVLEKDNIISIPNNPNFWMETKERETEFANMLKTAGCLRILLAANNKLMAQVLP